MKGAAEVGQRIVKFGVCLAQRVRFGGRSAQQRVPHVAVVDDVDRFPGCLGETTAARPVAGWISMLSSLISARAALRSPIGTQSPSRARRSAGLS